MKLLINNIFRFLCLLLALYCGFISFVWENERKNALFLCFVFLLAFVGWRRCQNRIVKSMIRIMIVFAVIIQLMIFFWIYIASNEQVQRKIEYAVVLGDSSGELLDGANWKNRCEKAIELSEDSDCIIVLTGGSRNNNSRPESETMKSYLAENGVTNPIILEEKAKDTKQNFEYSAELIGTNKDICIVTSEVHYFRAYLLAKRAGFKTIRGYLSKTTSLFIVYCDIREIVATVREVFLWWI